MKQALEKRLAALEAANGFKPFCWVTAEGDEDQEQAIARHVAEGGCTPNNGGHVVWMEAR